MSIVTADIADIMEEVGFVTGTATHNIQGAFLLRKNENDYTVYCQNTRITITSCSCRDKNSNSNYDGVRTTPAS